MKIQTVEREVLKGGIGAESQFSIKATGKAFQILSSGLYSNKILAIIRELSCNAYDSHVSAGKADVPIEIHLPTTLKPTFYVKDFGIGLDDEDIRTIYTTYFESTKQQSNDFIGEKGLGSKSPFSYVSSFMIEARKDGTKHTYNAFINEQGLPTIALMNSESTDESNGLTVSMAVKRDDIYKFKDEAKKALMYFNPMPVVKGAPDFATYSLKHTLTGTNWKIRDAEYSSYMEGPYVIQGFVSYPIDTDQLRQHKLSEVADEMLGINVDLTVSMGDVETAASREALSYVPQTIKNVITNLEIAAKEIRAILQKEIDACSTLWEATKKFNDFNNSSIVGHSFYSMFHAMHQKKNFKWKGTDLASNLNVNFHYKFIKNTIGLHAQIYSGRYGQKFKVNAKVRPDPLVATYGDDDRMLSVHPSKHTFIYVDDVGKNSNLTIQQHILSVQTSHRDVNIVILRPTKKDDFNQKEIDYIINGLGHPDTILVSTLPKVVADGTKFINKRDKSDRLLWKGFEKEKGRYSRNSIHRVFSRLCWNTLTVDLKTGGFYVPVKRFAVLDNDKHVEYFDTLLEASKQMNMIKDDVEIYGFTDKEIELIKGKKKWVNLIDFLRVEFSKLNQNDELVDLVAVKKVVSEIGNSNFEGYFIKKNDNLQKRLVKGSFQEVLDSLATLYQAAEKKGINPANVRGFMAGLGGNESDMDTKISTKETELSSKWDKMLENYEMLSQISWSYVDQDKVNMIVNYVNLVDK